METCQYAALAISSMAHAFPLHYKKVIVLIPIQDAKRNGQKILYQEFLYNTSHMSEKMSLSVIKQEIEKTFIVNLYIYNLLYKNVTMLLPCSKQKRCHISSHNFLAWSHWVLLKILSMASFHMLTHQKRSSDCKIQCRRDPLLFLL